MSGMILRKGSSMLPPLVRARLFKRIDRIERLRLAVGADVYYPLANTNIITVRFDGKEYESPSLRRIESLLRYFKKL